MRAAPDAGYNRRMPTEADLHPRTRERLADWAADPDVVGAIWVGSRSRGYGDGMSDDDLEILLTPAAHARIAPGDDFEVEPDVGSDPPRLIYDAWRTTLGAVTAKAASIADLDHWPYEAAVVLLDRDGSVARAVAANAVMPQAFRRARLQHNANDAIVATIRARKGLKRGFPYATRMLLARAAKALTRVAFALEDRWTPLDHWLEPELASLTDAAGAVPLLRQAILAADPQAMQAACDALRPPLESWGVPSQAGPFAILHAELLGPSRAEERKQHALD